MYKPAPLTTTPHFLEATAGQPATVTITTAFVQTIDPIRQKPVFRLVTTATLLDHRHEPPTRHALTLKETARTMPTPTTKAQSQQHEYFLKQTASLKRMLRNYLKTDKMEFTQ